NDNGRPVCATTFLVICLVREPLGDAFTRRVPLNACVCGRQYSRRHSLKYWRPRTCIRSPACEGRNALQNPSSVAFVYRHMHIACDDDSVQAEIPPHARLLHFHFASSAPSRG